MKAIQYYGPKNIQCEEVPVKPPKEGEVVVKIMSALTCGTDVKTFRRGHPVLIKTVPSGFGHEFSGIVDRVGKNVKNVKVGDRVVAANSAPCGKCFYCRHEEYNLCENLDLLSLLIMPVQRLPVCYFCVLLHFFSSLPFFLFSFVMYS